jgi:hypothetical protein
VISSGVVAAFVNAVTGNLRANANIRRDHYAKAVRSLIAWGEYPYRIRRRTDDESATLAALADRGHSLQEQRAEISGWIAAESRTLSRVFDQCVQEVANVVGPACVQAWELPPVTSAGGMNLHDFGPRGLDTIVARMEHACRYRFGIRQLMWPGLIRHRLSRWERANLRDAGVNPATAACKSSPESAPSIHGGPASS